MNIVINKDNYVMFTLASNITQSIHIRLHTKII